MTPKLMWRLMAGVALVLSGIALLFFAYLRGGLMPEFLLGAVAIGAIALGLRMVKATGSARVMVVLGLMMMVLSIPLLLVFLALTTQEAYREAVAGVPTSPLGVLVAGLVSTGIWLMVAARRSRLLCVDDARGTTIPAVAEASRSASGHAVSVIAEDRSLPPEPARAARDQPQGTARAMAPPPVRRDRLWLSVAALASGAMGLFVFGAAMAESYLDMRTLGVLADGEEPSLPKMAFMSFRSGVIPDQWIVGVGLVGFMAILMGRSTLGSWIAKVVCIIGFLVLCGLAYNVNNLETERQERMVWQENGAPVGGFLRARDRLRVLKLLSAGGETELSYRDEVDGRTKVIRRHAAYPGLTSKYEALAQEVSARSQTRMVLGVVALLVGFIVCWQLWPSRQKASGGSAAS